jgi:uncharacterized protein (TIGR03086 family)
VTELGDRYRRRADAFEALIVGVPLEGWTRPSPVEGWQARDVVAHVVDYTGHVLRERENIADAPRFADFDDPAAAFRASRRPVERLLDDASTPAKLAHYVDLAVSFDLPQHGWDLAMATGQDATIAQEELDFLWDSLTTEPQVWEWQRANGWYGEPVPVPDDASLQDRVLGLIGRDPDWTPAA